MKENTEPLVHVQRSDDVQENELNREYELRLQKRKKMQQRREERLKKRYGE